MNVLLICALASAATPATRVLVLDLGRGQGIASDEVKTVGELLTASVAARPRFAVISHDDIRQIAALAADKAQAGCDDTACLAELAGALAADYVISGRVSRLGDLVVLNLSLFDAKSAAVSARSTRKLSSVGAIADELDPAVDELLRGAGLEEKRAHEPSGDRRTRGGGGPKGMAIGAYTLLGVSGLGAVTALGAVVVGELSLDDPHAVTLHGYQNRQALALGVTVAGAAVAVVAGGAGAAVWTISQ